MHKDDAGLVYAGVAPGALFASLDEGENWELNQTLNNHSSRPRWQPGAGGLCLHSIITDPGNKKRIFVGISAVGVFRSEDAGESWYPKNRNVRVDLLPSKYPEFGQCVHKLVMDSKNTAHLYQQNHCGVYKSEDAAESWIDITRGLPSRFGFPMITHPRKSGQLYVVPEEGDFFRVAANKEFAVYRTNNAGRTWRKLSKGLPRENATAKAPHRTRLIQPDYTLQLEWDICSQAATKEKDGDYWFSGYLQYTPYPQQYQVLLTKLPSPFPQSPHLL